ncbi:MAG: undecaprenyl-diphosphatase UppP [Acidobacteria bacterium]|nr:undecaprenyl-diphosphatase UppP [Acidobacteriota bacterium]
MILLYAALLGIIQGLTEFLPISSSAHLIFARALFGWDAEQFGLAFDVACHVGTLVAILSYFRRDVREMVMALQLTGHSSAARFGRLIVVGTIPIVVVGVLFDDYVESRLRTVTVATAMLALGALLMLMAERAASRRRGPSSLKVGDATAIGFAQAAALVPGVSRSGATIAVGLLLGLHREAAARFSFLLGIPAIVAAAAKEALELHPGTVDTQSAAVFGVGLGVSAVVGYLTVKFFLRYLARHSLDAFAYYRLLLAAIAMAWVVTR